MAVQAFHDIIIGVTTKLPTRKLGNKTVRLPFASLTHFCFFIFLALVQIPILPETASALNLIPLLDSELGNRPGMISYRVRHHDRAKIRHQDSHLARTDQNIQIFWPVFRSGSNELNLYGGISAREFETELRFPSSERKLPDDLYRLSLGFGFEHINERGWLWNLVNFLNSPTDKPLANGDVIGINSTLVLRIPHRANNALILFLNYSSIRSSFKGVPLPGIGYWYERGQQIRTMIGLPFALDWRPAPRAKLLVNYIPVRDLSATFSYQLTERVKAYLNFDWSSDSYLLADRTDIDERLHSYEKRLGIGLQIALARFIHLDLSAGYVFDSYFFFGEGFEDRENDRVDLEGGAIFSASLNFGFKWW